MNNSSWTYYNIPSIKTLCITEIAHLVTFSHENRFVQSFKYLNTIRKNVHQLTETIKIIGNRALL